MDAVIDFVGRDTFILLVVYIGANRRAGKAEKVPVLDGLILSFTPFFVVLCLLYIFEGLLSIAGLEVTAKVMAAIGGIFGYLGNYWLSGLAKNGKVIEEGGAVEALSGLVKSSIGFVVSLVKSAVNVKKTES